MRMSGSSLFTLGFATPDGAVSYGIVFVAAISGIAVIALMIGYMPTLYAAYNRRETLVTMLEALSGTPPSGQDRGHASAPSRRCHSGRSTASPGPAEARNLPPPPASRGDRDRERGRSAVIYQLRHFMPVNLVRDGLCRRPAPRLNSKASFIAANQK
jgi:hypothetical protein